jgi:hypothetical protein
MAQGLLQACSLSKNFSSNFMDRQRQQSCLISEVHAAAVLYAKSSGKLSACPANQIVWLESVIGNYGNPELISGFVTVPVSPKINV